MPNLWENGPKVCCLQMSLLDLAASCGVLDLDLMLLAGEETWALLLAHLLPGPNGGLERSFPMVYL